MNNKDIYHQHGYTKHYYVEADRIASKIGGGMSHSGNDFGEHIYEFDISTQNDYGRKSEENAKTMYNHLDSAQSNLGKQFEVLVDVDFRKLQEFLAVDKPEKEIFYFHKDHLGSSTQISDMSRRVIHHIEYMPTGELFAEQRDYWHTPYRFNGKELDEETGYYYYGARYYTPELGIWLSVDPLSDKYPSMSAFMYCAGNPVVLVDPDGREIVFAKGTTKEQKAQFYEAIKHLKDNECGGRYSQLVNSKEKYTVVITDNQKTDYDFNTKTISWSPTTGLETENGHVLSPTTCLNHEMAHATNHDDALKKYYKECDIVGVKKATENYNKWVDSTQYDTDKQYRSKEERKVITGIEQYTAKKLGEIKENEVTRTSHSGTKVEVSGPTSTTKVK